MSRRKQRESSRSEDESSVPHTQGSGILVPSSVHQGTIMGLGNITGKFDITDGVTAPSVVFRQVTPYASMLEGWSKTGSRSDQDGNLLLSTLDPYTTPFFPITNYAKAWLDELGPVYNRLFDSSLTSYNAPELYLVARYQAALIKTYSYLYSLMVLNHITYHMDWSSISPYNGHVPKYLYTMCTTVGADDITLAQEWMPTVRLLENHILPPWVVAEIKRMLTPMKTVDLAGHILVPLAFTSNGTTKAGLSQSLFYLEQLIELTCSDARKVIQAYVPYPLSSQDIWSVADPVVDPLRLSGWFNSGCRTTDSFGDTGDPSADNLTIADEAGGSIIPFYSITGGSPTWEEVKLSTVYELTDEVDDEFTLLTPHKYGNIVIHDDFLQTSTYNGTSIAKSDAKFELLNFVNCRLAISDGTVLHGMQAPGYRYCEINQSAVDQLIILEVLDNYHYDEMRMLASAGAGNNIRLRRREIHQMFG